MKKRGRIDGLEAFCFVEVHRLNNNASSRRPCGGKEKILSKQEAQTYWSANALSRIFCL